MKIQYLLFFLIIFFACKKDQLIQKQEVVKSSQVKEEFQDNVMVNLKERMPVLKACYDKDSIWKDIKKCSDEMLFCLLYTSPSPRDATLSRMPSSA